MKTTISIFISLCLAIFSFAQNDGLIQSLNDEKNNIESCYAQLENETLIIGNAFIERRFRWNNGNIISTAIIRNQVKPF